MHERVSGASVGIRQIQSKKERVWSVKAKPFSHHDLLFESSEDPDRRGTWIVTHTPHVVAVPRRRDHEAERNRPRQRMGSPYDL